MNILDLNVEKYNPFIIDAMVEVCGESYRKFISSKINKAVPIFYSNVNGVKEYTEFLENWTTIELSLEFLRQIGINVKKYDGDKLDDNIMFLIKEHLGGTELVASDCEEIPFGIKSFDTNISSNFDQNECVEGQIEYLNFLRGSQHKDRITLSNYEEFKQTQEYKKLINKIQNYLNIYNKLLNKFIEYKKSLQEYKDFIKKEEARKNKIYESRKAMIYKEIALRYPSYISALTSNKRFFATKKENALLKGSLDSGFVIEAFSSSNEETINNPFASSSEKAVIYKKRLQYLKDVGVNFDFSMYLIKNYEEEYLKLVKNPNVAKFIPTYQMVDKVKVFRTMHYDSASMEFISSSQSFIDIFKKIKENPYNKETVMKMLKHQSICVFPSIFNLSGDLLPLLFFTVRANEAGQLDYALLHEYFHIVGLTKSSKDNIFCGFDDLDNTYIKIIGKRKYEILNETLTDLLAIETLDVLRKKGLYILEPKETVFPSNSTAIANSNNSEIFKNILKPFLAKFRSQTIEAIINSNPKNFIEDFGLENFEELNDAINTIGGLLNQGLKNSLEKNNETDLLIKLYNTQLKRIQEIYSKISNRRDLRSDLSSGISR